MSEINRLNHFSSPAPANNQGAAKTDEPAQTNPEETREKARSYLTGDLYTDIRRLSDDLDVQLEKNNPAGISQLLDDKPKAAPYAIAHRAHSLIESINEDRGDKRKEAKAALVLLLSISKQKSLKMKFGLANADDKAPSRRSASDTLLHFLAALKVANQRRLISRDLAKQVVNNITDGELELLEQKQADRNPDDRAYIQTERVRTIESNSYPYTRVDPKQTLTPRETNIHENLAWAQELAA